MVAIKYDVSCTSMLIAQGSCKIYDSYWKAIKSLIKHTTIKYNEDKFEIYRCRQWIYKLYDSDDDDDDFLSSDIPH